MHLGTPACEHLDRCIPDPGAELQELNVGTSSSPLVYAGHNYNLAVKVDKVVFGDFASRHQDRKKSRK
jgi:hypothetical protein